MKGAAPGEVVVKVSLLGREGHYRYVAKADATPISLPFEFASTDLNQLHAQVAAEVAKGDGINWVKKIVVVFSGGDVTNNLFGEGADGVDTGDYATGARFSMDFNYVVTEIAQFAGVDYCRDTATGRVTRVGMIGEAKTRVVLDYSTETEEALKALHTKATMLALALKDLLSKDKIAKTLMAPPWVGEVMKAALPLS